MSDRYRALDKGGCGFVIVDRVDGVILKLQPTEDGTLHKERMEKEARIHSLLNTLFSLTISDNNNLSSLDQPAYDLLYGVGSNKCYNAVETYCNGELVNKMLVKLQDSSIIGFINHKNTTRLWIDICEKRRRNVEWVPTLYKSAFLTHLPDNIVDAMNRNLTPGALPFTNDYPCYVSKMDYIEGENMKSFLMFDADQLKVDDIRLIFAQLVIILHKAEVTLQFDHNDIKLQNIMISRCKHDETIEYRTNFVQSNISSFIDGTICLEDSIRVWKLTLLGRDGKGLRNHNSKNIMRDGNRHGTRKSAGSHFKVSLLDFGYSKISDFTPVVFSPGSTLNPKIINTISSKKKFNVTQVTIEHEKIERLLKTRGINIDVESSLNHSAPIGRSLPYACPQILMFEYPGGNESKRIGDIHPNIWSLGVCLYFTSLCGWVNDYGLINSVWPCGKTFIVDPFPCLWSIIWNTPSNRRHRDVNKVLLPLFKELGQYFSQSDDQNTEPTTHDVKICQTILYLLISIYMLQKLVLGNELPIYDSMIKFPSESNILSNSLFYKCLLLLDDESMEILETVYCDAPTNTVFSGESEPLVTKRLFFSELVKSRLVERLGSEGLNMLKRMLSWTAIERLCSDTGRISGFYNLLDHPYFDLLLHDHHSVSKKHQLYNPLQLFDNEFNISGNLSSPENTNHHADSENNHTIFECLKPCGFSVIFE